MSISLRIIKLLNIAMYILVIVMGLYIYKMRSQEQKALNTSVNILDRQIGSLMQANKKMEMFYQNKISQIGEENKKLDAKFLVIQDKIVESPCFSKDKDLIREVYEVGFLSKSIIENIVK